MSTVTAFTNVYYKRVTGTPRACFVCHKPTTTVLATAPTTDFIYTCDAHLLDPGFATRIADPVPPEPSVSADAIAKIKEEYEAAQKRKQEKAKDKGGDKDKKEGDKADKDDGSGKDSKPTSPSPAPSGAKTPTHEKYALHRHMFALRVDEHRRRRQSKDAQTLAPRLPGAPTGNVG